MTIEELQSFFNRIFPGNTINIEKAGEKTVTLRYHIGTTDLRPGDTVSGPVIMTVADAAIYLAIMSSTGTVYQDAVTSSLNFNFLKRPVANKDIIGECRLIKLGRKLAVGEVTLFSEGETDPVAHAVGTYALPDISSTG